MLRSCSIVRDGMRESNSVIECEARPELGLFEPFRGRFKCPIVDLEKMIVAIPVD